MLALLLALQTTTCIPLAGQFTCYTQSQPYVPPPPIAQVDVRGAIGAYERGRARRLEQDAPITAFQEELARRMAILARQGRCDDAERLAALAGEVELVEASRRVCHLVERRP